MTTIDPRLADRRKEVAEDRARHNIKRLLRLLIFLGILGAVVWLFLSPALSASSVDLIGVSSSRANEILTEEQVVSGRPLILIQQGSVEGRLLSDPWIKSADVNVSWPNKVEVIVDERTPVAWVETGDGWTRRAVDGVALPGADTPDDTMAHISLPMVDDAVVYESFEVIGALEFVAALPVSLSTTAVVELREGELWASVAGYSIRLGRPVEMEAKALTLAALLQENLTAGSEINLIAPANPSVGPPGREVAPVGQEEEDADGGSGDNSTQP
ncbi:MAG TPA: FtsQ-type POTRA domain-containing protein [Acidimicrobiia bacterium]